MSEHEIIELYHAMVGNTPSITALPIDEYYSVIKADGIVEQYLRPEEIENGS